MTTFSRLFLNPQRREARKLLTNRQAMHAAVRSAFPPDLDESRGRVLWRVDSDGHSHTLYIVAPEQPDLTHLVEQAGWFTRPGDTADYGRMLGSVRTGAEFRFRFTGNPVRRDAAAGRARGDLFPHVTAAQQLSWLQSKGTQHGFELLVSDEGSGSAQAAVTKREELRFSRGHGEDRRTVTLRTAQFDGALKVADAELLRAALVQGIGRAKAYGCGLMTLSSPSRAGG